MSVINIANIAHSFGGQEVLSGITLAIETHSRIGVVGKNGCGKSTLFRIIAGQIFPTGGEIHTSRGLRIAYLTQDPQLDESQTLLQCVLASRPDYTAAREALEAYSHALDHQATQQELSRYAQLEQAFEAAGGYNFTSEIKRVLMHLQFPQAVWMQPVHSFSGGEKTRIQLARFLLQPFDVMLLDEPTNHLDISMIYWLEEYLTRLKKPFLVISHDRSFLQATATSIAEIHNGMLTYYPVDYEHYLAERTLRRETQRKQFNQQQKLIETTEDFIRRNMAGQKVQQAKSRLKMLNRLERIQRPEDAKQLKIKIQTTGRSGNDVCKLENCSIGFGEKVLAQNINMHVYYQDKIAILGKNGCGKTTLLRALIGEQKLLNGSIQLGAALSVGYYDQLHINLGNADTVFNAIHSLVPTEPQGYVLGYLARFGFRGEAVEKPIAVLSGGEKARLYLARLIHQQPNFLILDEPTNHLDMDMIDSLEEALQHYDGTIIFVSHDRDFINRTATRRWYFDGTVLRETDESLEALFRSKPETTVETKPAKQKINQTKVNPIVLQKKEAEIEALNQKLEDEESQLHSLHMKLADKALYQNPAALQEVQQAIAAMEAALPRLREELDTLELEYLEMLE